jgi:PAS domain S-box-containing protein
MSRRTALRVLLAVAALLAAGLAEAFTLRYGGDQDFAPFESTGPDGRAQGFQIELLAELARAGGFELSIELAPWPSVEAGLRSGRFDAIAMVDVPARRDWALFTRSYATPALAIYRLASQPAPQALQALAGQTVAVPAGEPMRGTRAAVFSGIDSDFIELPTALAALQAVAAGQASYALLPRAYGDRVVASGAVPGVVAADFSLRLQPYAFAVAPGNEALRGRLDEALGAVEASGRLEALRIKWLSSHRDQAAQLRMAAQRERDRVVVLAIGAGAIVVLALLAWQLRRRTLMARREKARRREAEAALREAQARLEKSFARHPQAMLVAEFESGVVQDVNDALCRLLGAAPTEIVGKPLDALPALAEPANLDSLRRMLDRDGNFDAMPLQVRRRDGSLRLCLVSCELLTVGGATEAFSILCDVTDELAANAQLLAAYDESSQRLSSLEAELQLERMRRRAAEGSAASFTNVASLDLKAPLRNMRGFVGLLQENLVAGRIDQAHDNARQIDLAAQRMEAMVAALARLAEVDRASPSRQDIDMGAMALAVWTGIANARAPCTVRIAIDALPHELADPSLVAQVWKSLLDNACKFSARTERAEVRVDSFEEGGRRWYRVTDNGAGFDRDHAARLFQPFQRMHANRNFEGLGVGLSLAHHIVRRHAGELRLHSRVGVGTVAEFTLQQRPV